MFINKFNVVLSFQNLKNANIFSFHLILPVFLQTVFITLTVSIYFILTRFLKDNMACLRASKNPHKMSLERYLMNRSTPFSLTC